MPTFQEARKSAGLTQEELGLEVSRRLGKAISRSHAQKMVSLWELGKVRIKDPLLMKTLRGILGPNVDLPGDGFKRWITALPSDEEFKPLRDNPLLMEALEQATAAAARRICERSRSMLQELVKVAESGS